MGEGGGPQKEGVAEDREREEPEVRCGYFKCRPALLQTCNNSKFMLFVMCVIVFTQGFVVNGVMNVIVSTLERRFLLRSTQMGWIVSAYDFSAAFLGIVISYLGSGRYKARWLTGGTVALLLGSVVLSLPHFTTGHYEWGRSEAKTCDVSGSNVTSTELCAFSGLQQYVGVFAFSNVIFGVGGATLYTVGTAYIDDSVNSVSSPLYLAIFFGFAALGPGIGYLVTAFFLNLYVDFDKVDISSISLTTDDARWVGAWWVAPLLCAAIFFFCIFPMSCFGAELPTTQKIRESRVSQLHKGSSEKLAISEPSRPDIRSLPKLFLSLLQNPPFLFTTLAGITESMLMSGLSAFGAKYIQNKFRVSTGTAGLFSGGVIVVGLAGGITFGGLICRCFRLRVKGMLKFCIGCCAIATLCVFMFFMSCEHDNIAGVHSPYFTGEEAILENTCNSGCGCNTETYQASCSSTGTQYFSPCYAGCAVLNGSTYSNCSCVPDSGTGTVATVTLGSCSSSCKLVYGFLVVLFVYSFATIAADVPAEQSVLRSIPENHKAIMCGANRFFIRLLGTIPGSVLMGVATDAGCLVWQTECEEDVSCWVYDNDIVSRNYFIIGIVTKLCSLLFFFLAHWFYIPPKQDCVDFTVENGVDNVDVVKESPVVKDSAFEGTKL